MAELDKSNNAIQTYGPWAAVLTAVLVGAYVLGDVIITAMQNLIHMGILGVIVVALALFMPVVVRALRYLVWGVDKAMIEGNPILQLEIGLKQHAEMITAMEGRTAEANAYYGELSQMLKQNRTLLSQEDVEEFEDELKLLKEAGVELIAMRDEEITHHRQFQAAVTAAKARNSMGKAFKKATAVLAFDKKAGMISRDNKVAFDSVNRQLNEGLSRMQLALSRPKMSTRVKAAPVSGETTMLPKPQEKA